MTRGVGDRYPPRGMARLVVCCDGTWSTPWQGRRTNVVRLYDAVLPRGPDRVRQHAHYVEGVGTRPWERLLGGVFGLGLSANVTEAYRFLAERFEPGDDVHLVGFSRGAYTARSTAGLIRNAGLLRREHLDRLDEAYALYRGRTRPDDAAAVRFRERWSHETRIRFVGVWDTVGALGVPRAVPGLGWLNRRWQFHDTTLSSSVDVAAQALAIDERRPPFAPTLWVNEPAPGQRVAQVWFAGSHADVGGGHQEHGLADVALVWLAEQATSAGLALDPTRLTPPAAVPRVDGRLHPSRRWVFRMLPAEERTLGTTDHDTEAAASAAVERQDRHPRYAPNLRAYRDGGRFRRAEVTTVG